MRTRRAVLVALAAAATLTSVAAAAPDATKQRVAITTNGVENTPGKFVLTPLQAGALKRDSGTESAVYSSRVVMREGQRVTIDSGVDTLKGKRGSLTLRFRIEWVQAGNGYYVGTGTWKVDRGTGDYSRVTGGGRGGHVFRDRGPGPWSGGLDGFLTRP